MQSVLGNMTILQEERVRGAEAERERENSFSVRVAEASEQCEASVRALNASLLYSLGEEVSLTRTIAEERGEQQSLELLVATSRGAEQTLLLEQLQTDSSMHQQSLHNLTDTLQLTVLHQTENLLNLSDSVQLISQGWTELSQKLVQLTGEQEQLLNLSVTDLQEQVMHEFSFGRTETREELEKLRLFWNASVATLTETMQVHTLD